MAAGLTAHLPDLAELSWAGLGLARAPEHVLTIGASDMHVPAQAALRPKDLGPKVLTEPQPDLTTWVPLQRSQLPATGGAQPAGTGSAGMARGMYSVHGSSAVAGGPSGTRNAGTADAPAPVLSGHSADQNMPMPSSWATSLEELSDAATHAGAMASDALAAVLAAAPGVRKATAPARRPMPAPANSGAAHGVAAPPAPEQDRNPRVEAVEPAVDALLHEAEAQHAKPAPADADRDTLLALDVRDDTAVSMWLQAHALEEDTTFVRTDAVSQPAWDAAASTVERIYSWPFTLDTWQRDAVYWMYRGEHVFVAAHTSAGKTVAAEFAIALAAAHGTRCVYTSPIKALSNQKFRDFRGRFPDVGLVTGDMSVDPDASCVIMTTEILRSMLYRGADLVRDVEWVVFDEVHYINDADRGGVYEEVLIMLPPRVKLVFLSATVSNVRQFAEWVGRTKRAGVHVLYTSHRPVPLLHHTYARKKLTPLLHSSAVLAGQAGQDGARSILPAGQTMLDSGYKATKALLGGKGAAKGKGANSAAGGKSAGPPKRAPAAKPARWRPTGGSKNDWLDMVRTLAAKELLPAVVFSFSKKRCEECARALTTLDLTTPDEKHAVHAVGALATGRLSSADRSLPQVTETLALATRGVGVHHGGMLPILKELVEILFGRGLVKVLWATETFAMGVNMPAKCVVFNGVRKHDGVKFRTLLASEYTQMAGRAGRRGLDECGTVAIAAWCEDGLPEFADLKRMLAGTASPLMSRFKLSYSMLLSLLRLEDMNPEDMMKQSYSEFAARRVLGSTGILQLRAALRAQVTSAEAELQSAVQDASDDTPELSYGALIDTWHAALALDGAEVPRTVIEDDSWAMPGQVWLAQAQAPHGGATVPLVVWVLARSTQDGAPAVQLLAALPPSVRIAVAGSAGGAGTSAAQPPPVASGGGPKLVAKRGKGGRADDEDDLLLGGFVRRKGKGKGKANAVASPSKPDPLPSSPFTDAHSQAQWQLICCPLASLVLPLGPLPGWTRCDARSVAALLPAAVPAAELDAKSGALKLAELDADTELQTYAGLKTSAFGLDKPLQAMLGVDVREAGRWGALALKTPAARTALSALLQAAVRATSVVTSGGLSLDVERVRAGEHEPALVLAARTVCEQPQMRAMLSALAHPATASTVCTACSAGYALTSLAAKQQDLTARLSATSLALFPDMSQRLEILRALDYIHCFGEVPRERVADAALAGEVALTVKGRVAAEVNTVHELVLGELVFEGVFNEVDPAELAALLAALVAGSSVGKGAQEDTSGLPRPPALCDAIDHAREVIGTLAQLQSELQLAGMTETGADWAREVARWGAVSPVYAWARGVPFVTVMALTDLAEGTFVRLLTRVDECLREVRGAARIIGDHLLFAKATTASHLLKRDVCFATSLYVA